MCILLIILYNTLNINHISYKYSYNKQQQFLYLIHDIIIMKIKHYNDKIILIYTKSTVINTCSWLYSIIHGHFHKHCGFTFTF